MLSSLYRVGLAHSRLESGRSLLSFGSTVEWGSEQWWDRLTEDSPNVKVPLGWRVAGITAGLKESGRRDLAVFYSQNGPATSAAMFTKNSFPAAPVLVSREELTTYGSQLRGLVVNSGQANACTGKQGLIDARDMVDTAKRCLSVPDDEGFAVMSTGVIGVPLKMDTVLGGVQRAAAELKDSPGSWIAAAEAITTTDNRIKIALSQPEQKTGDYTLLGVAKGAGMIHPNMATLLSIVTTDVAIDAGPLQEALHYAANRSWHSIDVDGDTSTNDTLLCMANGAAGGERIQDTLSPSFLEFRERLTHVCVELSQKVVFDAEGATRFVAITINGARSYEDARTIGQTVAQSSLFKCAMWGGDANWGRAICAVGYSGVPDLDLNKIDLTFTTLEGDPSIPTGAPPAQSVRLVAQGQPIPENRKPASLLCREHKFVNVQIDLGLGSHSAQVYTCDLTPSYVKFNGAYTT